MGMKVARATEKDLDRTHKFLSTMEMLFDSRSFHSMNWQYDLEDDDEDKIELLRIHKEVCEEYELNEDSEIANELTLFQFIKDKYRLCDLHWNSVFWAASIMIDLVIDPQKSYLDWHPFIERAIDNSMLGE